MQDGGHSRAPRRKARPFPLRDVGRVRHDGGRGPRHRGKPVRLQKGQAVRHPSRTAFRDATAARQGKGPWPPTARTFGQKGTDDASRAGAKISTRPKGRRKASAQAFPCPARVERVVGHDEVMLPEGAEAVILATGRCRHAAPRARASSAASASVSGRSRSSAIRLERKPRHEGRNGGAHRPRHPRSLPPSAPRPPCFRCCARESALTPASRPVSPPDHARPAPPPPRPRSPCMILGQRIESVRLMRWSVIRPCGSCRCGCVRTGRLTPLRLSVRRARIVHAGAFQIV